jgi:hypothetical protein
MDAFEVPDAVLAANTVPTLVVGISSDELYPAQEVRSLADRLAESTYWELQSPHGHDAFSPTPKVSDAAWPPTSADWRRTSATKKSARCITGRSSLSLTSGSAT